MHSGMGGSLSKEVVFEQGLGHSLLWGVLEGHTVLWRPSGSGVEPAGHPWGASAIPGWGYLGHRCLSARITPHSLLS